MIRDMTADDIPRVVELLKVMRKESPVYDLYPEDGPAAEATLTALLLNPDGILVQSNDGIGVMFGYVGSPWFCRTREAYELVLYVDPLARGGRTAWKLITAFEQRARDRQAEAIVAGATAGISNDMALRLYALKGYSPFASGMRKVL